MNTTRLHIPLSRGIRGIRRASPALYALLVFLLVLATEQMIEHFARQTEMQRERAALLDSLSTLRARLEGVVNANLLLVHGLTAVISAHPDMDQAEFARISRGLVDGRHALRNIAAAPDMVVSMVYPLAGNASVLGLDYRTHPGQRAAALRVLETGKSWVAGPLPLVQGGVGIVARVPVFVPAARPGEAPRFWGLISAVIDSDVLYRQAGLDIMQSKLRLAIRGTDGTGAAGPVFFGDAQVFAEEPVTQTIFLPGGTWQMAALPLAGWGQGGATTLGLIRVLGLAAAFLAATLTYFLGRGGHALADSEARLRALLNTLPDLVWLKDPDGRYLACNHRLERLLGLCEPAILGRIDADFMPAEQAAFFRENDLAAIAAGGPRRNEEWLTFADDGHREWVETIKTPVYDSHGDLLGVLGIARDITAYKQMNTALQESETRYRHLFEHNPAPMLIYARGSLRMLAVNESFISHYGYAREEALTLRLVDLYPEGERRGLFDLVARLGGLADAGEWRHLKRDGEIITVDVRSHDLDYQGHAARIVVINDITARKQAENALREQEAFFRLISENMGDLVAVLDLDGRRLYNSPSYGKLFGDASALKGTDSFAEIHPDDRERIRSVFKETVASGQGKRTTYRFVLPGGEIREMEAQGGVIRGADGAVQRVVVVSRDITERRRMEDEIRRLNVDLEARVQMRTAELAAAIKELETFTYSVSHDLKAPLRGIDGYSRLLLEDQAARLDEEGRLFLGNVRRGVEQMNQLIDDLLAYSRMERRDLHGVPLDLRRQVEHVLAERDEALRASGTRVSVDVEDMTVRADPDGLALVLRNLVDNAIKFSRDSRPATLTIEATPIEESVILAIQDNGIGFDMQFHDRIFDIFQRLQRAEDYPGTGIGLAIVRKAMQRMGGRVWAESAPGEGATFYLELPR